MPDGSFDVRMDGLPPDGMSWFLLVRRRGRRVGRQGGGTPPPVSRRHAASPPVLTTTYLPYNWTPYIVCHLLHVSGSPVIPSPVAQALATAYACRRVLVALFGSCCALWVHGVNRPIPPAIIAPCVLLFCYARDGVQTTPFTTVSVAEADLSRRRTLALWLRCACRRFCWRYALPLARGGLKRIPGPYVPPYAQVWKGSLFSVSAAARSEQLTAWTSLYRG